MSASELLPGMIFPPVSWWIHALKHEQWDLAEKEHWVKQTYRNRYEIAGPNDRQKLSIPVHKPHGSSGQKVGIEEIEIAYEEDWTRIHIRTLESAYRKSPYYGHYSESVESIINSGSRTLSEMIFQSVKWGAKVLGIEAKIQRSGAACDQIEIAKRRELMRDVADLSSYIQVFDERHGFLSNLSVLDLVFNLGPEASILIQREFKRCYSDSL